MDYGKVDPEALSTIDFTLPADPPETTALLSKQKKAQPRVFVGCAKWGRKEWVGKIYPEKTKEEDFLELYAQHFNAIELNATFYKLPREAQVKEWCSMVGPDFKFSPKFNNKITHIRRLKGAEDYTEFFLKGVAAFGQNLGPLFLQLPPNYPPKNLETLREYLKALPTSVSTFVELRNAKWFEPEAAHEAFHMLEETGVGSVITDTAGERGAIHMRLTTPVAFIRFVGNDLHPTDYSRVDAWVQRVDAWLKQGLREAYFFMHQNEEVHSPELCRYTIRQLNKVCALNLKEPTFVQG